MPWSRNRKNSQTRQVPISPGDISSLGGSLARSAETLSLGHHSKQSPSHRRPVWYGRDNPIRQKRSAAACCSRRGLRVAPRAPPGARHRGRSAPAEQAAFAACSCAHWHVTRSRTADCLVPATPSNAVRPYGPCPSFGGLGVGPERVGGKGERLSVRQPDEGPRTFTSACKAPDSSDRICREGGWSAGAGEA